MKELVELVENYSKSQSELGDFLANNIVSGNYKANIKESLFNGYFAELVCEIENLEVSLEIAKDFICYHERDGIKLRFSPEVEREVIKFAKEKLNHLSKEEIKSQIKNLEEKLKKLDE